MGPSATGAIESGACLTAAEREDINGAVLRSHKPTGRPRSRQAPLKRVWVAYVPATDRTRPSKPKSLSHRKPSSPQRPHDALVHGHLLNAAEHELLQSPA